MKRLIKLANHLDSLGLYKEASELDRILKTAVDEWKYYGDNSPEDYEDRVKRTREHKGIPPEEKPEPVDLPRLDEPEQVGVEFKDIISTLNQGASGRKCNRPMSISFEYDSKEERWTVEDQLGGLGFQLKTGNQGGHVIFLGGIKVEIGVDSELKQWYSDNDSSIGISSKAPPMPKYSLTVYVDNDPNDWIESAMVDLGIGDQIDWTIQSVLLLIKCLMSLVKLIVIGAA